MEDNKEKYARRKTESRNPLPVDPSPPVPNQRAPLKPINSQDGASTGTWYHPKLDTRHVTKREQSDDELWKDTSVVIISSGEEEVFTGITETVHEENLEVRPSTSNDIFNKLLQNVAKAVQDLSSPARRLIFPPTRTVISYSIGDILKSLDQLYQEYATDVLNYLRSVEERPSAVERATTETRAMLLNWLIQVDGRHGDTAILQTASWYLDKILQHGVNKEKLLLMAAACYRVAQKLYDQDVPASKLIDCFNNSFTASKLVCAEMVLLKSLNFPRQPVIPDDFIGYFASWCDPAQHGEVEEAATFLFMSGALVSPDISLDYPSSVAAAAVRNAVMLTRKPDALDMLLICPEYKSAEAKAKNFNALMSSQRVAARTVADAKYAFNTLFHQYGAPPTSIAQKVVEAAGALAITDSIICRSQIHRSKFIDKIPVKYPTAG